MLAVLLPLARALGAPLGEPVAEDFDYLTHARFTPGLGLLSGGGSGMVWRPLSIPLYYELIGPIVFTHPGVVALLHTALLAATAALVYRALSPTHPRPWSAFVASFPLLSESVRMGIAWPANFGDVAVGFWTALALHETSRRRLPTALGALALALLSKEVALVAALLLPWLPGIGPAGRKSRVRWALAMAALAAAWAATAAAVRAHAGLELPEPSPGAIATKLGWSLDRHLRAALSLPAVEVARAPFVLGAAAACAIVALAWCGASAAGRARLRRGAAAAAWGGAWFVLVAATAMSVHPDWTPNRSAYSGLGLGLASASALGSAHPALLAAFTGVRLAGFALAPPPPRRVAHAPPETGADMDFERLVRLQRLMRDFRTVLRARVPEAPPGLRAGILYLPLASSYALGGSNALRAWSDRSGARAISVGEVQEHPDSTLDAALEFEPQGDPQAAWVDPAAVRAGFEARARMRAEDWTGALALLDRAEVTLGPDALVFRGMMAAQRARALLHADRFPEAEREARRALTQFAENFEAHYVLGGVAYVAGDLAAAAAQLDSALIWSPGEPATLRFREIVRQEALAARRR